MRLVVALLVCCSFAHANPVFKCRGRQLTKAGNFPHPNNGCSPQFFSCPEGANNAVPRDCPAGLVFDIASDECLGPEFVGTCPGGQPTKKPVTTIGPPVSSTTKLPAFEFDCQNRRSGDYNHPNKPCSHLYASCAGGQLFVRSCPAGLYFDAISLTCLAGEYVKTCGGKATTPAPPKDEEEPKEEETKPDVVCSEDDDYFVPNPKNACSGLYYSCAGGVPRRHSCPATLVFDLVSVQCLEPPYVTACNGHATTPTTPKPDDEGESTTTEPLFDCSDKPDGNYPSDDCAAVYFTCVAGVAYPFTCPGELRFSPQKDECQSKSNVESCPESKLPQVPKPICEGKVDGFYPVPGYCEQYVFCFAQEPFLQVCAENLVFHPTINKCVPPSECTAPCGTAAEPAPFTCANKSVGYYTRNDCAEYYFCEENEDVWEFECSPGFAFDVRLKECFPKVHVPECLPQDPVDAFVPFCLRRSNGLHPHPTDCHYGIVCLTGVAFELPCPTAELPRFDPEIGNCGPPTDTCQADANQRANIGLIIVDERAIGQQGLP